MTDFILRCESCGEFTMKEYCTCGGKAKQIRPPKFSPDDQYVAYRRKAKEDDRKKAGLI